MFRLFQVLDPSVVHGPMLRNYIGRTNLASAVSELLSLFEIPLHLSSSGKYSTEEIKNSFTAFRTSEVCEELWKVQTAHNARGHNVDYAVRHARNMPLGICMFVFTNISHGQRRS